MKFRITKIISNDPYEHFTKICTHENNPLYGNNNSLLVLLSMGHECTAIAGVGSKYVLGYSISPPRTESLTCTGLREVVLATVVTSAGS